jgi:tight adherence protein B
MRGEDRNELGRGQHALALFIGCAAGYGGVWLLTFQPAISLTGVLAGLLYPRWYRNRLLRVRREKLRLQFRELLQVLSSLLAAGRSVENAFLSVERDLAPLIGDYRSELLMEMRSLANRLRNGEPLEPLLQDFARRSKLEEAGHLADAFSVCKRAGGDLVEIIRRTSQMIGEKMEVEMEVAVLMSQKRFEARIMMVMPFAFIGLLGYLAPDYMTPLRQGGGWLILLTAVLLLAGCCWWMGRIMRIEV